MKFIRFRKTFYLFSILAAIFLSTVFSHPDVEIEIPRFFTMKAGEKALIPINIKNSKLVETKVFLNIFPPYYEGISAYLERNEILISPNSEVKVNLIVSSPLDIIDRIVAYTLYVSYDGIVKNYRLDINIIGEKREIVVENYGINKQYLNPEEELLLFVVYKNSRESTSSVRVRIEMLFEDRIIKIEEKFINILRYSYENYTFSYKFSYFDKPGKYYINIYSFDEKDNIFSRLVFEVVLREIKEVKKDVERTGSLFSQRIVIRLKNAGNVNQTITWVEKISPIFRPFTFFENYQPEIIDDKAIWYVELGPQEEIIISFTIFYWMVLVIVSIFTGSIMFYIFFFILVPKVSKKLELSEDLYKIKIVIKNNTQKRMKNIEVSDFLPSLFSPVEFETIKPQIKKIRDGYNLVWKLSDLKPNEELIISYKIKPLIEIIGKVKLPPPKVKYILK